MLIVLGGRGGSDGHGGEGAWMVPALAYREVEGCEGAVEDAPGFRSGHLLTAIASSSY